MMFLLMVIDHSETFVIGVYASMELAIGARNAIEPNASGEWDCMRIQEMALNTTYRPWRVPLEPREAVLDELVADAQANGGMGY